MGELILAGIAEVVRLYSSRRWIERATIITSSVLYADRIRSLMRSATRIALFLGSHRTIIL